MMSSRTESEARPSLCTLVGGWNLVSQWKELTAAIPRSRCPEGNTALRTRFTLTIGQNQAGAYRKWTHGNTNARESNRILSMSSP